MMSQSYQSRYSTPLMFLHWLMFILIVGTYVIINVRGYLPEGDSMRASLMWAHKSIGVALLVLIIFRLLIRWTSSYPPISPPVTKSYHRLVVIAHYSLYLLLLAMSISGYVMSSAAGREVVFLDWVLPNLVGKDEALSQNMYDVHIWSSQLIYVLVVIHVLMALWHHFVRKDNTLIRMMPHSGARDQGPEISEDKSPVLSKEEIESVSKTLVKPVSTVEKPKAKPKVVAKPKAAGTKAKSQEETKSSGETKAKAATKPKTKAKTKAVTAVKSKTVAKSKTTATAKPRAKPAPKSKVEPKA